jgi:hypothetical protein
MRFILFKHAETAMALLLSETEAGERVWIPKSQVEVIREHPGALGEPDLIELDMPEWLAEKKGFL